MINEKLLGNVYKKNIFSTDETIIGTWIDGKSIYRKVIVVNSLATNQVLVNNVSRLISIKGEGNLLSAKRALPFALYYEGHNCITVTVDASNNIKSDIVAMGNPSTATNVYMILEYTKTTD